MLYALIVSAESVR